MDITSLLQSFVPSTARPLSPRPHLVPAIYLTCIAGSFLPPGFLGSSSVALTVSYLIAEVPRATTGDVASDVLTPIQALLVLIHWVDFYIVHDPQTLKRRGVSESEVKQKGWWERFKWYGDLHTTSRGIGWDWEVKNIPKAAPLATTKWQFVRSRAGEAVIWYLLFDVATSLIRHSPYSSIPPLDIANDTFPRQLLFTWLVGCTSYWGMVLQYSVFSALAVTSGLYSPQDWPPLFGRLRDVTSVRGLWGKFWHQMLRRKLNVPFQILKRIVRIEKGTLFSRYGQLYLAFTTSAVIHAIGALNVAGDNSALIMWPHLNYFLVQPLAITFEDLVKHLGRKWGFRESAATRWLGRAWTFAWFSWSLRLTATHHYQVGVFRSEQVPSLVDWILGFQKPLKY